MKASHIVILLLLALVGAGLPLLPSIKALEDSTIDARFNVRGLIESKSKVVVVAIDDKTEKAWKPIPKAFWAGKVADLSTTALAHGALKVGVDIVVAVDADTFLLNRGLQESPNFDLYNAVEESNGALFVGTRSGDDLAPPLDLLDASRLLSVKALQSDRSVLRELPRRDESFIPPLKGLAYGLAMKGDESAAPIQINYSGRKIETISAEDLLKGDFEPSALEGAVVLIGETYTESQDRFDTPFVEGESGVLIHAAAVETLLEGRELIQTPLFASVLICGMLGLASCLIAHALSIGRFIAVALLFGCLLCVGAQFVFTGSHIVVPLVAPIVTFSLLSPLCIFPMKAIEEKHERLWARSQWGQMVSDEFVTVLEEKRSAGLGSMESFTAALLFLDVAGFSEKSNRMSSQEIVEGLNLLLEPVVSLVGAHGGTVLNFIGDGVVAMFHKSDAQGSFQENALRASTAILLAVDDLKKEGGELWDVRIGMAVGDVSLALVGSKDRKQMTVYGSAVNMAARLEQAGKSLGTRLAVSVEFKESLGDYKNKFVLTKIQPKGWDEEVEVLSFQE